MKHILFFLSVLFFISCVEEPQQLPQEETKDYHQRVEEKLYPFEGFYLMKNYPNKVPDFKAYQKALQGISKSTKVTASRNNEWVNQGPGNIGGRINTIAVHPNNPDEIMLGYSLGGIFKSTDIGISWLPIFDDQPISSISDIEYNPLNPDEIFVATGDHNISGYPVNGMGIYKSEDGGNSWQSKGLEETGVISEIQVANTNDDIVYVATMGIPFVRTEDRGLYKSIDGGESWNKIFYLNDSTGVIDIEVHPTNPNIVYATAWTRIRNNRESVIESTEGGIYKTEDGGDTWTKLTNGLPEGQVSRAGLAMYENNPDTLYSLFVHYYEGDECSNGYQVEGIYRTNDGGMNWDTIPRKSTGLPCNVLGGFGWYFGQVRVNPNDADHIFVLGVDMYETRNAGLSWEEATPPWFTYEVHADKHDLVFSDGKILLGTDGGGYQRFVNGSNWTDIENNITTQFYRVTFNPFEEDVYFGGAQDNGTTGGNDEGVDFWPRIFGGDGFQMRFNPLDSMIHYVETQNGRIRGTVNGGIDYFGLNGGLEGTRNWDMQYILSPHDPYTLFTGTDKIYKRYEGEDNNWFAISDILTDTTDLESAYVHTMSAIDQSPIDSNIIYAGFSDGYVWNTLDGGETWNKIDDELPVRYISSIKASPDYAEEVFLTIQGYKDFDNTPYIYKSEDNGSTWISIQGDLPQIGINDVYIRENTDGEQIFLATDAGVYFTLNAGENWNRLGSNMPIIPVYDLEIDAFQQLIAGSFARGIYTYDLVQLEDTDVEEVSLEGLTIYPTLTEDIISIQNAEEWIGSKYMIVSMQGNTLLEGNLRNGSIEVSSLPAGNYVLSLMKNNKNISSGKFIKL